MTKHKIPGGRSVGSSARHRLGVFACLATLLAFQAAAIAEPRPSRGGILEFAVDAGGRDHVLVGEPVLDSGQAEVVSGQCCRPLPLFL